MNISNPSPTPAWQKHPNSHYEHLANHLPQWLLKASTTRRAALGKTPPHLREAFRNATPGQHTALKRLNAAFWTAQNGVDERLEHLEDARSFGEPLLRNAIKQRCGLDLDVKATFLRLYIPASIPWFPIKSGAARIWTVSLLDAALHNFEPSETSESAHEPDSTFITQPSSSGQFETLNHIKNALTIPAFTTLCRELDIGGQYQTWLEDNLGVSNPVAAAVLRPSIMDSQKAALLMALELARLPKDRLKDDAYRAILALATGAPGRLLDGKTLLCHDLTMMAARLTGIILFAPDLEQHRGTVRVIAYIPDDPQHPIKEYPSSGHFMADLSARLRSSDYQQFFSRFVDHADRGYFFANLNNRLTQITWHPRASGDPLPSWRESPAKRTNLQFSATPIRDELWEHLYQRKLDKILNDARILAVSTASADRKARWELWDSFTRIASTLLEIAAFVVLPFVPVLGEMMMAYMVYQLLDEAFESIIDWSQGLTRQALEHTLALVESIVQLGAFAVGGSIAAKEFRNVMPKECVAFIDRFMAVKSANGRIRYWNGDLRPYEQNILLPTHSKPDASGLHTHAGKRILPLENRHYEVTRDATRQQFQIEHPTRSDAYKPLLEHNNQGTWHTELEQPLQWDRRQLLQRLGHVAESLSGPEREQVLRISGYHENTLRRMHVDHETLPPLLADTLQRFKIDKDIQTFIDRIASDHIEAYTTADPATQLQLLTEHFPWPENKALRLLGDNAEVLWQQTPQHGSRIHDLRTDSGDVLRAALNHLTEDEIKALFDEPFGAPALALEARARQLRSRLADVAKAQRSALFDARYRTLQPIADPLAQHLMDTVPGLPGPVAEALLDSASGTEWQQLEQGTVPPRLKELAQWAQQQVRAVRARESLELGTQDNPDAARLALHSVSRLPGWSGDVRIELNRYSFDGENIDRIGRPDATLHKVLVQLEDGDYQAFDEWGQSLSGAEDFYNSVLRALPDSERKALNLQTGQGVQLRHIIMEHALGHDELQAILSRHPLRKPHYDPSVMRLPGGADGYPNRHPGAPALHEYVHALYPSFNATEAADFVHQLHQHPSGARAELTRLHDEYRQMNLDLRLWLELTPLVDPQTGARPRSRQLIAARRNRELLVDQLQRCWRRQTALNDGDMDAGDRGYMFRFTRPIFGELPIIGADFSHVAYLTLEGSETTRGANAFLRLFTGLRRMEVRNIPLTALPDVTSLPNLDQLIISNCGITLSVETEAALASLSRMRTLELYKNPLGRVFSVEAMTQLDYIDLGETGISSLPPGLLNLPTLDTAIFSHNQLTELPAPLFQLPVNRANGFDFGSNPLSIDTLNRVKTYFQQTREHLGVFAPQDDIERAIALYPTLNHAEANEFVFGLPGTLEAGRAELTRLETEYTTLSNTLTAWTGNVPPLHPVSGEAFSPAQLQIEHNTRDEFRRTVQQGWRRETELDDFNDAAEPSHELSLALVVTGELPTLSADFSHVSHLYLHSYAGLTSVSDGFLRCFPRLKGLTIRDYRLGNIPPSIFNMGELVALVLPECRISLTPETVAALAGMEHLDYLDLSDNPLLRTPDVSQMPELSTLILNNTHITELPPGLLQLQTLDIANLSNNAIRELPSDILELPTEIGVNIDLSDNPLSERSLTLLIDYFRLSGHDFGVEEIINTAEMEASNSDDSETEH